MAQNKTTTITLCTEQTYGCDFLNALAQDVGQMFLDRLGGNPNEAFSKTANIIVASA